MKYLILMFLLSPLVGFSQTPSFQKVMIVIFENIDYKDALNQPNFKNLATNGALFTNFYAEVHPSQGNYIALVAGSNYGVVKDSNVNIDALHIGDQLEKAGKSWKIYLEGFPGNCFTGERSGTYVRKHNPFISFKNIQNDRNRCNTHLVEASELDRDITDGTIPDFSIYIPDLNNDAHDTGVAFGDRWLGKYFGPKLKDSRFMKDMLFITTFDEASMIGPNHIYTTFFGDSIVPGSKYTLRADHYSILRTLQEQFGLGTLQKNDQTATPITGIWK